MISFAIVFFGLHQSVCVPFKSGRKLNTQTDVMQFQKLIHSKHNDDTIIADIDDWSTEDCNVTYIRKNIKLEKCHQKQLFTPVCQGHCRSVYQPQFNENEGIEDCRACLPTSIENKIISLECDKDAYEKFITIQWIKGCHCRPLKCSV